MPQPVASAPIPPEARLPSIEALRAFEAAVRLGTFERAAEELSVTASAIGKRVGNLEALLDTALLVRTGKTLAATAPGKEYFGQVRAALALLADIPLHRRAGLRRERLRVTAPPTFARQILVPHLQAFTDAHPGVELEVVLSIPYLDVSATDADIEVRNGDAAAHGGMPLMRDVVVPMAAPSLLARLPLIREPADLRAAPLLRTPLEPWAAWFAAAGLDWPEPDRGPKLVDLGLLLEAAVSGQGVALARPSLAHDWLASGALVPLFGIVAAPRNGYYLLPHTQRGAAAAFAQWLVDRCERAAAAGLEHLSGRA